MGSPGTDILWEVCGAGRRRSVGLGRRVVSVTEPGEMPALAARYSLGPVIGTGGMARVHRATDTLLERAVAVKVFRLDADPVDAARIENEARTLASVQHPGLVSVYDAGTWRREDGSDVPYLVMELVDGPTLDECCLDGTLAVQEVTRIGAELADALAHVHGRGIVHRDVKPGNILLDRGRRPKLTDFGIARLVDSARHTQTGMRIGTAAYLSPEQISGGEVAPPSDIYSLGLVLLEALTGHREYPGISVETALARLERPPVVPPDLPDPLRSLLQAMTARDPQYRPNAAEVAAVLRGTAVPPAAPPTEVLAGRAPTALLTEVVHHPSASAAPATAATDGAAEPRGVVREVARDAARNPYVLGACLFLLAVVGLVVVLAATGGSDSPSGPAPPPAPVSQLDKDLAELRKAVTP